ncbi:sporulation integral membrane protein YlbJ [Ferviditalea candida]|uniref:Sporulation integral membrane protein YlbJ n=1 Tax=Ferviditalea candida TaxID=3108399 RepID=A0ABU5ZCV7_9BACL|nr:sporulation integral membrane protein YlbJ [Paenibacillaceae bacterium T2]
MQLWRKLHTPFIGFAVVLFILLFVYYPAEGMKAAARGVEIWWDILFPALFPFFVISEVLLGFGIVHFWGTLLDPLMRPLFRVPGIGGFVMAMGFASGYPVGARLTSQLWDQRLIDRAEAERLVAFTSTSDPIFLIGAVSVGFFHDPSVALILAVSHYGGALLVGLLMRFYGPHSQADASHSQTKPFILYKALQAMHRARLLDGRPLGILLKEAVQTSLRLIFVVGGLVVFFSSLLELLSISHIMDAIYGMFHFIFRLFRIPDQLVQAFVNGLFEVTLGAKSAGTAGPDIPLIHKAAAAAFILSWSGLSVHAQIVSLLTHTKFRYLPFVVARFIHGLISVLLVLLLWIPLKPVLGRFSQAVPVFHSGSGLEMTWIGWSMFAAVPIFFVSLALIPGIFGVYRLLRLLTKLL